MSKSSKKRKKKIMAEELAKTAGENKKCECITLRPVADVTDEHDGVEIAFEIPGCGQEDITVEVKDRLLTLNARSSLHRRGMPIVYKRAFYLSDAVDTAKITAKTADGVLNLFLPKAESAKTHRIAIE